MEEDDAAYLSVETAEDLEGCHLLVCWLICWEGSLMGDEGRVKREWYSIRVSRDNSDTLASYRSCTTESDLCIGVTYDHEVSLRNHDA